MSVEVTNFHSIHSIKLRGKLLSLDQARVMAILNVTPDSFYVESRKQDLKAQLQACEQFINEGAEIIDVGAYSSRQNATHISEALEIERSIGIIRAIRKEFPETYISVDTFRSEVAKAALNEGADLINDISGGQIEPAIFEVAGEFQAPYILMHLQGTPQTMQAHCTYRNLFMDISRYFSEKIEKLHAGGVHDIILDPGFGFSKDLNQNYELMKLLPDFQFLEKPLLVGISRKSMIYKKLQIDADSALNGTTVLNTYALLHGAKILRVHDVKEAKQAIDLLAAIQQTI